MCSFLSEIYLIYNIVLGPDVQQSDSFTYIDFRLISIIGYYKIQ